MTKKELIARQQAIVDAAKNAGRALTAQEQQEFENLQRSLENMPDDTRRQAILRMLPVDLETIAEPKI